MCEVSCLKAVLCDVLTHICLPCRSSDLIIGPLTLLFCFADTFQYRPSCSFPYNIPVLTVQYIDPIIGKFLAKYSKDWKTVVRMNLLILEAGELDSNGTARLSDARATHIHKVLAPPRGGVIRVGIVNGPKGTATVETLEPNGVALRCRFDADTSSRPMVDLLLALPRPKVMKRLWSQLAALGVDRIILTNAEKVERNYFDTHVLDEDTYRPLLLEGLQQAQDTHLPELHVHKRFKVLVEDDLDDIFPTGVRLVADPSGSQGISKALENRIDERVLIAVGPEGGWTAYELVLLKDHGFEPVSMGPRTLRTDTACIALLSLVHQAVGR